MKKLLMTAKQLVDLLQQYPQDATVMISAGRETDYCAEVKFIPANDEHETLIVLSD